MSGYELPEYTCPKKDKVIDALREMRDSSVMSSEIKTLQDKIIREYEYQYNYYIDQVINHLDSFTVEVYKIRELHEKLRKELTEARAALKLFCEWSPDGEIRSMYNTTKGQEIVEFKMDTVRKARAFFEKYPEVKDGNR